VYCINFLDYLLPASQAGVTITDDFFYLSSEELGFIKGISQ